MISPIPGYQRSFGWNLRFSSYWFAASYKWFILLFVVLPELVKQIVPGGEKNTWWGVIYGTGAIWAVFGPSLFGRISESSPDKFRQVSPWIAIGSALTCIALFAIGFANSLLLLGFAYWLLQVSDDLGTGPYAGMIASSVPEEHRGYSSSILGGLKLTGQIVSAVAAMALGEISLILVAIALVNIVCAILTIGAIRKLPPTVSGDREKPDFVRNFLDPFKSHDFRYVWLNRFVVTFGFIAVSTYTKNYLEDAFDSYSLFGMELKDASQAALVLALTISISGIVGSIVAGKLSDQKGRKPILKGAALLASASLFGTLFFSDFTALWMFVFVFGIGYGAYLAADWALASDVLPAREKAATQMGAWQSSETTPQIFAGGLGLIIDSLNRASPPALWWGYKAMILFASVGFLASIPFVKQIRSAR